jgi:hypothetical protein
MDEEVEPTMRLLYALGDLLNARVTLHVERQHERPYRQRVGQLANVLLKAILIGEDEGGAGVCRSLCDGP